MWNGEHYLRHSSLHKLHAHHVLCVLRRCNGRFFKQQEWQSMAPCDPLTECAPCMAFANYYQVMIHGILLV